MIPLVSPRWGNVWNLTSTQWSSQRAAIRSYIYPSGVVATPVDSVNRNIVTYTLPSGCSKMDQYVIATPGGRVCTEPQHTYLLYPTTTAIHKLLVWFSGHGDQSAVYYFTDGSSLICRLLALGWHVLVCTSPSGDWNIPPGSQAQHITIGGTLTSVAEHAYQPLDVDAGPNSCRMWTDEAIRSTTQAISDVAPTKVVLAGHSGGGVVVPWIASCVDRFDAFYQITGGLSIALGAPNGGYSDYEQAITGNPVYSTGAPAAADVWRQFMIGAAISGRHSGLITAQNDEYWPMTNTTVYTEQSEQIQEFVAHSRATVSTYLDTTTSGSLTPNHNMTPARVTWIIADMIAAGI